LTRAGKERGDGIDTVKVEMLEEVIVKYGIDYVPSATSLGPTIPRLHLDRLEYGSRERL
jgi:hypothetical protein